jgi:hypothetical protein
VFVGWRGNPSFFANFSDKASGIVIEIMKELVQEAKAKVCFYFSNFLIHQPRIRVNTPFLISILPRLIKASLKGLSHEIDFKNFDKKLHNLA